MLLLKSLGYNFRKIFIYIFFFFFATKYVLRSLEFYATSGLGLFISYLAYTKVGDYREELLLKIQNGKHNFLGIEFTISAFSKIDLTLLVFFSPPTHVQ